MGMAAIAGLIQDVPIMYIIAATALTFAMVAHGALRFSELGHRMAVEHKLQFVNPYIGIDCDWDSDGRPTRITKLNIGVILMNQAIFPIEYTISNIDAVVEGRIADATKLEGFVLVVGSGSVAASATSSPACGGTTCHLIIPLAAMVSSRATIRDRATSAGVVPSALPTSSSIIASAAGGNRTAN